MKREELPNEASREDKMREALAHYEELATKACWHRSDIPEAIRAYYAPLPPAEGAEKVQRCPVCMGRGLVPNNFYATTSGIGSTTQTYLPEKCRTCNGAGVIILPYPKLQPTAERAEEILTSLIKSLGEPTKIHNHIYEIRPYTVEGKTEWWMFHNGVGSGEPLAQWLNKFATLHAQQMAEKMVRDEIIKFFTWWLNESIEIIANKPFKNEADVIDEYLSNYRTK